MSKHTPGPWFAAQPEECGGWWIVSTDPEGCDCIDSGDGGFEEYDARLIAAAPELLEALEQAVAWIEGERTSINALANAKSIISKARGEG